MSTLLEEKGDPNGNLRSFILGSHRGIHLWLEFVLRALVKSQGVSWGRLGEDGNSEESNKTNVLLCQVHLNYIHPFKARESSSSQWLSWLAQAHV